MTKKFFLVALALLTVAGGAGMIVYRRFPRDISHPGSYPPPSAAALAAQAALAREAGILASDITVLATQAVLWPDSSLGCPQPGRMYAQVMTPGFAVRLRTELREYVYHTDEADSVAEINALDCTDNPNRHSGLPPAAS